MLKARWSAAGGRHDAVVLSMREQAKRKGARVEFRVLGPLEVHREGAGVVPVRAAKERALLLILLLHANEIVPAERLIDDLWGERPPASAVNVLQTYVSHLRRLLDPADGRGEQAVLVTRRPGYLLRVRPEQLDLDRFERLVAAARSTQDPAAALATLREGLALWRGPPLQEFAFEEFARTEIARLEELRLAALEERIELELRLGEDGGLVGELEALVAAHPLRERLRGQLMLALYRSGRQAEALQAYQEVRRLLVDELGIEPSAALRELERSILRQDDALAPQTATVPAAGGPAGEVRKTVTVLFSDLVDSTQVGGQLDPEAFRRLMSRYFESMRVVLERHGGTLEKYIGDAVMAVFGIPVLHEDDALRAVRAAAEMRDTLAQLNDEIEEAFGIRLAARTGVNSGEVVAGDPSQGHMLVTGDAVQAAKQLEEFAKASEILIGEATRLLVRNAALVEPVDPLASPGIAAARTWRLLGVLPEASALPRSLGAPLVNRELELTLLRRAFDRAVVDGAGHFVTLLGAAGVGKSRLVHELLAGVGDGTTIARGRCLPYGEGITYWPLAEVVREALGGGARGNEKASVARIAARLEGEENAELIAARVAETLGVAGPGAGKSEETFWAVRKLFEALARRRPLVVVFDDLHWAEPTFLDLVEHLADSRDTSLLLLCIARPELLEQRPTWGGGKLNATTISLDPLNQRESRQLIGNLLDSVPIPPAAEERIAEAAEGNPLFTEELVAMLIDDDLLRREGDRWVAATDLSELPVPPSIHTLLAARVERLPDDERALLGRAAVEGTVFHRSAVAELSSGTSEAALDNALIALMRKDVIRLDGASFATDDAYRFRHGLIRDAAYRSLPKQTRADLHERFAAWLERAAGGRLREFEEIVGYHLEQAYRYRVDLRALDSAAASLAARAAERLESGGRKALARGDLPAAIGLLERAASLVADDTRRAALLPELGAALMEAGRLGEANRVLDEARLSAAAEQDECAESRVLIQQQFLQLLRAAEGGTEDAARAVARVVPVFERCDDQQGLCSARRLEAWLHWNEARAASAAGAWEQAAAHARRAGDTHARDEILTWIASSLWFGPTPVAEGIRRCEEIRDEVSGNLESEALTLRHLGGLHAMDGRFELARALLATSNAVFEDLGLTLNAATSHTEAVVEMKAGDPVAAERSLRTGYKALENMGEKAFLSTTAAFLARALFAQGRDDEAERFAEISAGLAARGDVLTQVLWRGVRARILAGRGRVEEAEALAREAVRLAETTDFVNHRGDALIDLAQVLEGSGRTEEARRAVSKAFRLYELKGNTVALGNARARLVELARV